MSIKQWQFNSTSIARSDTARDLTDAGQIILQRQLNAWLIQRPLNNCRPTRQPLGRSITADEKPVI